MINLDRTATRYVSKLANNIKRRLAAFSTRKDFSGTQGRTLAFLLARSCDLYQKDIEEEYCLRPASATELLKQMERNGLIRREEVDFDRRLKKICVTEKAMAYRDGVVKDITELEEDLVRGIPEEELEIFMRVAEKMLDNLSEGHVISREDPGTNKKEEEI